MYFRSPKTTQKKTSPTTINKQIHRNHLLQQFINPLLNESNNAPLQKTSNLYSTSNIAQDIANNTSSSSAIPHSKTFQTNNNNNSSSSKSTTTTAVDSSMAQEKVIEQAKLLTKQTQEWISKAKDDQVDMIGKLLGTITQTNDPITQKNALQILLQQTQNLNKHNTTKVHNDGSESSASKSNPD